jgi:hypothetical protein
VEAALFTVMAANTWTNIGNRAAGRPDPTRAISSP